jgi:hypothetical protein
MRLTPEDESNLDYHEGVRLGLYRREFLAIQINNGGQVYALVYVSNDCGVGHPRPGYVERVLAGAKYHQLPDTAVAHIQTFMNHPNQF